MKGWLCQIDAWNGGSAVALRAASHDDERLCHLNGLTWWPAIAKLPVLRYDFFDGSFEGQIVAPTGDMQIQLEALPTVPSLQLQDARIRLWRGELGDAWGSYTLIFDGRVQEQPVIVDGVASISIGCDDSWLDEPLLGTYAGTGNAEGSTDLKGNVKPLLIGAPRFVEGVPVDTVDLIYQLSTGSINQVELAFDQLVRFGAASANYSTFAALKAATVPAGEWATCLAQGFVRMGAPPDGVLTFHVRGDNGGSRGWVRRAGSIIHRIAEIKGALAKVNVGELDALDAACPWNLSAAFSAQTTARAAIIEIAQSVNAVPIIDWLGILRLKPVAIGTPVGTLAADGSALPPVGKVQQLAGASPWWRLTQKAEVTHRVHTASEISIASGTIRWGTVFPSAADSVENDLFFREDWGNQAFIRGPGDGLLYNNGALVLNNGEPIGVSVWFPISDERIEENAEAILAAQAQADAAYDLANEAIDAIDVIDDDGIISTIEKRTILIPRLAQLQNRYAELIDIAALLSVSSSAAATARSNWLGFLAGLSPDVYDTDIDTPVDRTAFSTYRDAYDLALEQLAKAIDQRASELAQWADITGAGKPEDGATKNVPRGDYSAIVTYNPGDFVHWTVAGGGDGGGYGRIGTGATTGVAPSDTSKWQKLVDRGAQGVAGLNNAIVYLYKRSAADPSGSLPSGTFTYTFATGVLSGGTPNGWTQAIPAADGNPLWVIAAPAAASTATDSIAAGEFSAPVIDTGAGLNSAIVWLFKRAASAPAVPSATLTYTFATGLLSGGSLDGYSQSIPAHDGNPLYAITAAAIAASATDTIATGEWAAPQIHTANGQTIAELTIFRRAASAPATPTGGSYDLGTKVLTPPASWSITRPAPDGNPLFEARGVASGVSGAVTPSWAGVAASSQDGSATNVIFIRSATQPSTPAPSAGVPSGWSDDPDTAPGTGPMWSSFGTRANGGGNWTWLVAKRLEGIDGDDGASGISAQAYPPTVQINTTFGGAPKSGELAKINGVLVVREGAVTVTAGVTFSIPASSGLTGFTIDSAGEFGPPSDIFGSDISATLRATYLGVDFDVPFLVTKARDGSSANSGIANVTTLTGSGTYSADAFVDLTLANGATAEVYLTLTSYEASSGNYRPQIKAAYVNLTDSGSLTDISGTEAIGDTVFVGEPSGMSTGPGYVTNSTGSAKVFRFYFYSRRDGGSGSAAGVSGNITVEIA